MSGPDAMTGPELAIRSLRSVEILTPSVADAQAFYTDVWGLSVVETDGTGAWLRGTGDEHHVLALRNSVANGLGKITFALDSRRQVDRAACSLASQGLPLLSEPGPSSGPAGGYGFTTCDLEGRRIEFLAETFAVPQMAPGRARPVGVTHVVLNTTDIDQAVSFWVGVLGFRVSDWSEHQMAFLRCNSYHHSIAFNQAEWASLNHVAYEMPSVDDFMRGIGRLRHEGRPVGWGPGRHGPGDNTFAYFVDPAGLVCEYTAEVAQVVEETWIPRVWRRVPELSDTWGTAGPPSADIRSHMAGHPDPGVFAEAPGLRDGFSQRAG